MLVKQYYEVSFVAIDFTGKRTYMTIRINDKNDLKSMIDYLIENSPNYDIVVLGIKEK